MKKRILTILIVLALALSLFPVAFAEEEPPPVPEYAAQIGSQTYKTFSSALANAKSGDTIELLKDSSVSVKTRIVGKTGLTIDLNGKKLNLPMALAITIANSNLTIKDSGNGPGVTTKQTGMFVVESGSLTLESGMYTSTAVSKATDSGGIFVVVRGSTKPDAKDFSTLSIGKDATLYFAGKPAKTGGYGFVVEPVKGGSNADCAYGVVVNVSGTIDVLPSGLSCYINGDIQKTTGNVPEINIDSTAKLTGTIYAAGFGKWKIDKASVTGTEALSIKSGELTIDGGTYTAVGDYKDPAAANNNGTETTGAAVSITSNDSYAGNMVVNITGGTFISTNGYALYEGIAVNNGAPIANATKLNELTVSNGSFDGAEGKDAVRVTKYAKPFIGGGLFTTAPNASYVDNGKLAKLIDDDKYPFTVDTKTSDAFDVTVGAGVAVGKVAGELVEALGDANANALETSLGSAAPAFGLDALASVVALGIEDVSEKTIKALEEALVDDVDVNDIVVVVQPYLDIKATAYDSDSKALTLGITAKYRIVATTEAHLGNIKIGQTAVEIDPDGIHTFTVTEPVTIVLPLPEWYVTALSDNIPDKIFVKHDAAEGTYYYTSEYTTADTYITFRNPHGFSNFTVFSDPRVVDVQYLNENDAKLGSAVRYTIANLDDELLKQEKTGYTFIGWKFFNAQKEDLATSLTPALTMSVELLDALTGIVGVYATPVFEVTPTPAPVPAPSTSKYTITATAGKGGAVSPVTADVKSGGDHTVSITPNKHFVVADVLVDGVSVGAVKSYTFKNVKAKHTLVASFRLAFTDTPPTAWHYGAIEYVIDKGIMEGVSDTLFAPDSPTTRGMLATILWRLEGSPEPKTGVPFFTDLVSGWYTKAVDWAYQNKIVEGYGDGTFRPDNQISREDMAAILQRYALYKGLDVQKTADLSKFTDASEINGYALIPMQWAYAHGLIVGRSAVSLAPKGICTRAELAQVMMRLIEGVK